jgi:hypothetical protein
MSQEIIKNTETQDLYMPFSCELKNPLDRSFEALHIIKDQSKVAFLSREIDKNKMLTDTVSSFQFTIDDGKVFCGTDLEDQFVCSCCDKEYAIFFFDNSNTQAHFFQVAVKNIVTVLRSDYAKKAA